MKIALYLENGIYVEGESFGATGTSVGEIVFNTSLSGYQEIISDPSYAGQFITFTMPEIGNVGVNDDDAESRGIFAKAVIVRNYHADYSNFRATKSVSEYLIEHGILGLSGIDTRFLTKTLRENGSMMAIASTECFDSQELAKQLHAAPRISDINYIEEVSTKTPYRHDSGAWDESTLAYSAPLTPTKHILAFDFGAKRNILNELTQVGASVEVVPHNTSAQLVIDRYRNKEIHGVFLSNGPGDPLILKNEVREIRKLIDADIPLFGICLGHQLLSIAFGYETYKLKFGHHGGNHPVKNIKTGRVEITAQNHNYNVPDTILSIADVTHINLFDDTIEGLSYKDAPVTSVQFHPESSPGPHESKYLFSDFVHRI